MYKMYVDGSCKGNGKATNSGGFGVVIVEEIDNVEKLVYTYSKISENTTNNREELKAILYTMLNYGNTNMFEGWGAPPVVYSDSSYCVNTFNEWMFNWANNGWVKSDKKVPENLDLIKAYYDHHNRGYRIDLRKIKGHAGHRGNELADKLATGEISAEEAMKIYG